MSNDQPSWASESEIVKNPIAQKAAKAAVNSVVNDTVAKYSLGSTQDTHDNEDDMESALQVTETDLEITPEELTELKKWSIYLRVSFSICATLMIISGLLSLSSASLGNLFIGVYVIFFGVLICCYEIAFAGVSRWIAQNFGFMYTKVGRLIFILFVAFLCFGMSLFGIIVMCLLIVSIGGNFYVMYKCPKYAEWIRVQHFKNMTNK